MTKDKVSNLILAAIGIICPFLFCLCTFGIYFWEKRGGRLSQWETLAAFLATAGYFTVGSIGSGAMLTALIINRKRITKNIFSFLGWISLLLLFLVNFSSIIPAWSYLLYLLLIFYAKYFLGY